MCVEKPGRQAQSTESSTAAPRRKRATTERLHVFTPATPAVVQPAAVRPLAAPRSLETSASEPKRPQVASAASADPSREALEKAKTLPIGEARKSVLGLAKTQPLEPVEPVPSPRRVRPVAQLPSRFGETPSKPIARVAVVARPAPEPVKPVAPVAVAKPITLAPVPARTVQVSGPSVTAGMLPTTQVDDGWSQGRKRGRAEPASPRQPLKLAEGTQPGVNKPVLPAAPRAAGKHAVAARPAAERANLAEGSIPPPTAASGRPLPSLFSVIDRKKPAPQAASSSRLPGLPPPPPARPGIGPKKAVSTVVAAASLGSAHMAIAATRQTGEYAMVPPPAQMLLDDEVEEIEEIEPDLPDFVPSSAEVAGMLMRARPSPAPVTPLFDAPPRHVAAPPSATSFSAAEAAFFAAGEEMDTLDLEPGQESFDDLPGIERPSFWSRLKNRASAGH